MKEAILVDLGGTLMLPKPGISSYLEECGVSNTDISTKWQYAMDGLRRGDIEIHLLDGIKYAAGSLAEKYALSLFSDGPDIFIDLCLRRLKVGQYFSGELVIPNSVLERGGKKNPSSWTNAKAYLERRDCTPVACADDEIQAVIASHLSGTGISGYFINPEQEGAAPVNYTHGDYNIGFISARNMKEMSEHFLRHAAQK